MDNRDRGVKVFSLELSTIDARNLDIIMRYLENKKGISCKRGAAIRMLIADKYAEIVKDADSLGKSLDDYVDNK